MKNIHILPTDKPSKLHFDGKLFLSPNYQDSKTINSIVEGRNIYIISDEEINQQTKPCWCINTIKNTWNADLIYYQGSMPQYHYVGFKKIILTTDQDLIKDGIQAIDDDFLEWFVKNPSCEEVGIIKNEHNYEEYRSYFDYKIIIPNLEVWKDIPEFEGYYQVSNLGNVKSLERYVKGKVENRLQKENILSKRLVGDIGNQYYAVTLCNNKNRKQIKVSVLVAMAFLNHTPNGYIGFTVDHIDNNPLNNNVNNLQVITKRENSSKDRKGISKYTGVTFNKKSNKWRSQIWINGKNKTLGSFDDELEAHRAYQKELQKHLKS